MDFKTYEDWEESLDKNYVNQFGPEAWEFTYGAFKAGQQSKQAEIEHRTQVSAELARELIRKRAEIDALNRKVDKIREVIEEQYGELDYWADVAFDHVIEELDK